MGCRLGHWDNGRPSGLDSVGSSLDTHGSVGETRCTSGTNRNMSDPFPAEVRSGSDAGMSQELVGGLDYPVA